MPVLARTACAIAALGLGLLTSAAQADIAEVEVDNGDIMTFEYEGDTLRINMPGNDQQGYMLMRDGKMYVVSSNNGQPMVFDLGSAFRMFGSMAASATPDTADSRVLSLQSTGKAETLGGIEGEVFSLRFIGPDGREQQAEMVLSKHPLAIGFRDAVQRMAMTMARSVEQESLKDEIQAGEDMQGKLQALGMGVLRYGEDMQVRSITDTTVAAERFVLPAEPTDLGGMIQGALGGGQPGSRDAEEAPASATDALGKAFKGLFGK
jgi:hypothetical protein